MSSDGFENATVAAAFHSAITTLGRESIESDVLRSDELELLHQQPRTQCTSRAESLIDAVGALAMVHSSLRD